jgi:hypothetical protein
VIQVVVQKNRRYFFLVTQFNLPVIAINACLVILNPFTYPIEICEANKARVATSGNPL